MIRLESFCSKSLLLNKLCLLLQVAQYLPMCSICNCLHCGSHNLIFTESFRIPLDETLERCRGFCKASDVLDVNFCTSHVATTHDKIRPLFRSGEQCGSSLWNHCQPWRWCGTMACIAAFRIGDCGA